MGDAAGQLAERFHLLALAELLLRELQVGDVARFEQQIDDLAAGPVDRLHRDVEISGRSALALHPHLLLEQFARRRGLHRALHEGDVLAVHAERRRIPDLAPDRLARILRPPRRLLAVQLDHRAVGLHQDENFEHRVEDGAEARFAERQLTRLILHHPAKPELGFLGERDVRRDPDEADQLPVGSEARLRNRAEPAPLAVERA